MLSHHRLGAGVEPVDPDGGPRIRCGADGGLPAGIEVGLPKRFVALANAVTAVQPGGLLDCIDTTTWQPASSATCTSAVGQP
jgi:hypothetical protein